MSSDPRRGVVELERLSKRYGDDAPAVSDLTLRVEQGELLALLGPSGCGKTTTLRLIAGLVEPSGGRIKLDGADITDWPSHRRDMGVVFQSYALFPHLDVGQNIAFGLEMRGVSRRSLAGMVSAALAMVRLEGYEKRRIRELSGGQQQRVALARALVIRPKVLLLDEPLSNLDASLREELRHEIRDIQQQLGMTTVFVTHDQVEALSMADRIAVMKQGRVVQIGGPTEVYEHPKHPFVAGFVGRINSFRATVSSGQPATAKLDIGGGEVQLPRQLAAGQPVLIMIRPHRIGLRRPGSEPHTILDPMRNHMKGRIRKAVYVGDMLQYRIETGGIEFLCERSTRAQSDDAFAIGEEVLVEWTLSDTLVFEQNESLDGGPAT
jgi:putative spermidine/putrescine transport system ATP-binding protein